MLFNSFEFILAFLPLTLIGFHICSLISRSLAIWWLTVASIVFYGVWDKRAILFLLASILVNYLGANLIWQARKSERLQTFWLAAAITIDLGALCYFKYLFSLLNFFHQAGFTSQTFENVILPLGISFFTFTQIAYLVDLKGGDAELESFPRYAFFVTFFPHLIAGPILHHHEIMPQLQASKFRINSDDMAAGVTMFTIGLFKKVIIADKIAVFVPPLFTHTRQASFQDAWFGVLCYAMQLYFDFSGYSDMAVGLARLFSIRFPLNFNSPYKAKSIIDFWQRFHMTLTRYLTLYLYNPISLAITRREMRAGRKFSSKANLTLSAFSKRIAIPTLVTMFLAGVWHGAGFQYLIFGLMHGAYLTTNHVWRMYGAPIRERALPLSSRVPWFFSALSVLTVFVAVVAAQVFFRANGVGDAFNVIAAMSGLHGFARVNPVGSGSLLFLATTFVIVWSCPNSQQIVGYSPSRSVDEPMQFKFRQWMGIQWRPSLAWAVVAALVFVYSLIATVNRSEFLYFQF